MIAHVFKKKFQNKFNEDIELFKLLDSNKKIFSSYIIYQLLNFSREFKMESSKEYWKIDCIYYTKDKLCSYPKKWDTKLSVVLSV